MLLAILVAAWLGVVLVVVAVCVGVARADRALVAARAPRLSRRTVLPARGRTASPA